MRPLSKRLVMLCLVLITSYRVTIAQQKLVYVNLAIGYQPAIVELTGSSIDTLSTEVRNNTKLRVKVDKRDKYIIAVHGHGMKREVKDSIYVEPGETLIINVSSAGKCLYDLPDGAIPRCPKGHTDQIIPIAYGLILFTDDQARMRIDSTVHLGGCVVTDCDPQHYCKIHKIEF